MTSFLMPLDTVAAEINARLDLAGRGRGQKAADHRIAAGLLLKDAVERVKKLPGVKVRDWLRQNIKRRPSTAYVLLQKTTATTAETALTRLFTPGGRYIAGELADAIFGPMLAVPAAELPQEDRPLAMELNAKRLRAFSQKLAKLVKAEEALRSALPNYDWAAQHNVQTLYTARELCLLFLRDTSDRAPLTAGSDYARTSLRAEAVERAAVRRPEGADVIRAQHNATHPYPGST